MDNALGLLVGVLLSRFWPEAHWFTAYVIWPLACWVVVFLFNVGIQKYTGRKIVVTSEPVDDDRRHQQDAEAFEGDLDPTAPWHAENLKSK